MFNKKIKFKTKQILSSILVFNMLFINVQGLALAGELTSQDKDVEKQVLSAGTAGTTTATDIERANATYNAILEKSQQTNVTSTNNANTYNVSRDGTSVTITENPCYNSTQSNCTQPVPIYTTNTNGGTTVSYQPSNTIQYTVSDGGVITSDMLSQLSLQKDISSGKASSNILGTSLSIAATQLKNVPFAQRIAALALIYQNALSAEKIQSAVADKQSKLEAIAKQKTDQASKIQNKYNVLNKSGTASGRFDVIINPTIPTVSDGLDVTITLKPKNPISNNDFTVTATFLNPADQTKTEKLDVTEKYKKSSPFIVELGSTINRTIGERVITILYKSKDGMTTESATIVYNVSSYQNALLSTGVTVSNSVMGSIANADKAALDGTTIAIAGEITSSKWNESEGLCKVTLSDVSTSADTDESKIPSVEIQSDKISKDSCESNNNKYAAFNKISATFDNNGSIVFSDDGTAQTRAYGISKEDYLAIEAEDAANVQQYTSESYDIPVVRYDVTSGEYVESLAGTQGINWTQVKGSSGESMVSVYQDNDGNYQIGKPTGKAYSQDELSAISSSIGTDLSKVTISSDTNGMVVITANNGQIINNNNGFSQEYYINKDKNNDEEKTNAYISTSEKIGSPLVSSILVRK